MRVFLCFLLVFMPILAKAEVYRCNEPKGIIMYSINGHEITPDGFDGVLPVVIVDGKEMTIVWGDTKSTGDGSEKAWKATIFHHDAETINAIALDAGAGGSSAMLYTIDVKRSYLYMSAHKENPFLDASGVGSYVAKCKTK